MQNDEQFTFALLLSCRFRFPRRGIHSAENEEKQLIVQIVSRSVPCAKMFYLEKGKFSFSCCKKQSNFSLDQRLSGLKAMEPKTSLTEFRNQMRSGDLLAYLSLNCPINGIVLSS